MGWFTKKKKVQSNSSFDDDFDKDDPRLEGDNKMDDRDDGPAAGGPGGLGGGSDDNPYADDPAHKQLVKLLDSNGLVRHRRAFIRNSIYTVKHAKALDDEKLKKAGVFLEMDRKKLLRIFKDAEAMDSEIDKQREQEKMDMEGPKVDEIEDDTPSKKKDKKSKKEKKDKGTKGKKGKKGSKSDVEDELDELDDEPEERKSKSEKSSKKAKKDKREKKEKSSKNEKKRKDKKGKAGKRDKDDLGPDIEDEMDLELEEKEDGSKSKSKNDKKSKASKKDKKKDKASKSDIKASDLDDEIEKEKSDAEDINIQEEEEKPKKEKKDKKAKKDKKSKSDKNKLPDGETGTDTEADFEAKTDAENSDKDLDAEPKSGIESEADEPEEKAVASEVGLNLASETSKSETKVEKILEKPIESAVSPATSDTPAETLKPVEKASEPIRKSVERKMSIGAQALNLLNKKLESNSNKLRRSSMASRSSRKSFTSEDEEEAWWKSLEHKTGNEDPRIEVETDAGDEVPKSATKPVSKKNQRGRSSGNNAKSLRVRPEFSTRMEYITDEENNVLQSYRRHRSKSPVVGLPQLLPHEINQAPPMPFHASSQVQLPPMMQVQPPGQSTSDGGSPTPNQQLMPQMQMSVPMQAPYYGVPLPIQLPPPMYYEDDADIESGMESEGDDTHSEGFEKKYKYYKHKHSERNKRKAKRRHQLRQLLKHKQELKAEKGKDIAFKPKLKTKEITSKVEGKQADKEDLYKAKEPRNKRLSEKLYIDLQKDQVKDTTKSKTNEPEGFVSDIEVAEASEKPQPKKFGSDDAYFDNVDPDEEMNRAIREGRPKDKMATEHRIHYFHANASNEVEPKYDSESGMYVLRRKLAEVGASTYFPVLVKQGITSLHDLTLEKLEGLPIKSPAKKKSLIRTILQLRKGSRNLKKRVYTYAPNSDEENDADVETTVEDNMDAGNLGLKSALKTGSESPITPSKKLGRSKMKSSRNRHYFEPIGEININASDTEEDNVKIVSKEEDDAKSSATGGADKKSVTFDLQDEDEVSLPSFADVEVQSDSEMSLYSDYS